MLSAPPTTEWIGGAFARGGRSLGGGAFEEPSSVLWLTVGPYFADIRRLLARRDRPESLDRTQAFSGRLEIEGSVLTWRHDLDTTTRPEGYTDSARVDGGPDEFYETGEDYAERWVRVDGGQRHCGVAEHWSAGRGEFGIDARIVLVDGCAIAVWSNPQHGAALYRDLDGWRATFSFGTPSAQELVPAVQSLGNGARPLRGWSLV